MRSALSPEMVARIARLLNTTPNSWLRMQTPVDLWDVHRESARFKGIVPIEHRAIWTMEVLS